MRNGARDIAANGGGITDSADVSSSMLMVNSITNIFNASASEKHPNSDLPASLRSSVKVTAAAAGAAIVFANAAKVGSSKVHSGGSSKPPKPLPASGKFVTYNTTEDVVRELGQGGGTSTGGDTTKNSSGKQRRRNSFDDNEGSTRMYSAPSDKASGKQRKQSVAGGASTAPLTLAAVSAKTQKSPIEAWQSLPDAAEAAGGVRRQQDGGDKSSGSSSKKRRETARVERFSQDAKAFAGDGGAGAAVTLHPSRSGKAAVAESRGTAAYTDENAAASSAKKSRRRSIT